jgi:CheY-like chemotaxis protein
MSANDDDEEHEQRHFVRNRLAAIRNAAFYLQRRVEGTPLWEGDPRVPRFFALIVDELGQIERQFSSPATPTHDTTPAPASVGARVLVVDDHDGHRETLAALLADEGFAVEQAASFASACTCLESDARYDLVLLDRALGDHDGLELAPLVRMSRPAAKIVIVSGSDPRPVPGIDDVVGKDVEFEALLVRVRRLLVRA